MENIFQDKVLLLNEKMASDFDRNNLIQISLQDMEYYNVEDYHINLYRVFWIEKNLIKQITEEIQYRKSGIPLGVEIPAPARTTIRLYRPFLIDSISLSTENNLDESLRIVLRIKKINDWKELKKESLTFW